jgi:hypothetical protein
MPRLSLAFKSVTSLDDEMYVAYLARPRCLVEQRAAIHPRQRCIAHVRKLYETIHTIYRPQATM